MEHMAEFNSGAITLGYTVAGVFFLRFWRRTGDGLFGAFAGAFFLMALNSFLVAWFQVPREEQTWIYLLRLAAFALIIVAIVRKNMSAGADQSTKARSST